MARARRRSVFPPPPRRARPACRRPRRSPAAAVPRRCRSGRSGRRPWRPGTPAARTPVRPRCARRWPRPVTRAGRPRSDGGISISGNTP
ncbi:hypothetical protein C7C56_006355 [Massilia glaciei]|uniref:Uncharacterized protein n=1 Tax=Massilia glaciei TaxID=1524097 RepID=A0A2U2I484_9BURK|nr:hypothetical protein C7C56_006355 [Massilia glaciei]